MITVIESAIIRHAPSEVFAVAADPRKQLEWDPGTLTTVERLTHGPLGLGSRYRGNFKGFGVVEYEFADFESGRRFAHLAALKMGTLRHTFTLDAVPEGTRLTQEGQVTPSGLGRLVAPLLPLMLRRRFRLIAAELDQYLAAAPRPATPTPTAASR